VSAGAADDSSAEGMFPKAFDEVSESEFIMATLTHLCHTGDDFTDQMTQPTV